MTEPSRKLPVRAKHVPWLVIALILLIMAVTVAVITINLRRGLRTQIIEQDGLMLYAASMVPTDVQNVPEDMRNDPEMIQADLELRSLSAAEQKGVLAVEIFDEKGEPFFGDKGENRVLSANELKRLRERETVTISSYEKKGSVILRDGTQLQTQLISRHFMETYIRMIAKLAQINRRNITHKTRSVKEILHNRKILTALLNFCQINQKTFFFLKFFFQSFNF